MIDLKRYFVPRVSVVAGKEVITESGISLSVFGHRWVVSVIMRSLTVERTANEVKPPRLRLYCHF